MKNLFILLFVSICNNLISQTKEQTSNWLIEKLNENSELNDGLNNETICYIKDSNLIEKTYNKTFNTTTIFGIPIKSITKITVFKDKNSFTFSLFCDRNCINKQINSIVGEIEEDNKKDLSLDINNNDSTLYQRIPKALVHLIKIYGGNAKLIYYKEPF